MTARSIRLFPEPVLRSRAEEVDPSSPDVAVVVADLRDTLDSHVGVGIAAPQIGESMRIIAVDATRAKRPVPNHGPVILLNPIISEPLGEVAFREGCMSIPDLVAKVLRANKITVNALLPNGEPISFRAEGFEAVILQHEIDHLDGILFIDRVHSARDIKIRTPKP